MQLQDIVGELVERSPARVDVWFLRHDGEFRFDRSGPHAKRIYETLLRSKRSGSRIWFVADLPELLIVDVASEDEFAPTK